MSLRRLNRVLVLFLLIGALTTLRTLAGTTGGISGRITDDQSNAVAQAKVAIVSPSQSLSTETDNSGFFAVLNLTPDTYTVTVSKEGFGTAIAYGVTVQADQTANANVTLHVTAKTIGKVVTTAQASIVNKTVTGDLYSVSSQAINSYQGSAGGAETLYSQNGVVGSLPGVVRTVGSGGGYGGNGSLYMRGGSNDQVGFELEGIPLNRSFDSANATSFVTNGLGSLEVYTGGEPADAGRSMSGYINEIIRRGTYPGGGDLTGVIGGPGYNHTVQADVYGGTPTRSFTYYVSALASNSDYLFVDRHNLDNQVINLPVNDVGCGAFNAIVNANSTDGMFLPCGVANSLNIPISQAVWQSFGNPSAAIRDTVANLHWSLSHGSGLQDDLQALYVVGTSANPYPYAGPNIDQTIWNQGIGTGTVNGQIQWPLGFPYTAQLNQPYNPAAVALNTWPSSGNSASAIPQTYLDHQNTESSIEKLSYTRAFTASSFLRFYAYALYSAWNFDQATNGFVGGDFYQLHDNASGYTLNYQNQISNKHLLRFDADYVKDLSLRYNYANWFLQDTLSDYETKPSFGGPMVLCAPPGSGIQNGPTVLGACDPTMNVAQIFEPFAYWNGLTEIDSDLALADAFKPSDRWLFDIGIRFDQFKVPLTALQINGANGLAEQSQNQFGICLHGYAYAAGEPCFGYLTAIANPTYPGFSSGATLAPRPDLAPGATVWPDVSGALNFNEISPRFGATFTISPNDVLRFSAGRYVQPPATAYEEYVAAPLFGAGDTVSVLNRFYDGLGFHAVHNVLPQDSTNYDLSYERNFTNGFSAKITPFYRNTRNQILNLPVVPTQPTFITGYNFGAARIKGTEIMVRKERVSANGLSATLAATYTDSKIRFQRSLGGQNFIDVMNGRAANGSCIAGQGICGYNQNYGTRYPELDPNGYYSPSITQSPTSTSASYDVRWVVNLNADYRTNGWDITPSFTYQSGNPYGDPQNFPDAHCPTPGAWPGCIPLPAGVTSTVSSGPDPYTNQFDAPGSLKGPAWLTMNVGFAHDVGRNMKASMLITNVFTSVYNHGYPWELPARDQALEYADNSFYNSTPLGLNSLTGLATTNVGYYGDNYYPYGPQGLMPARAYIFSLSAKI